MSADGFEQHRGELTVYCSRMLGPSEAEDAVQETLVRAWRACERFEGRAPLRSWLYRIARNVCLDMLEASKRRARPIDLGAVGEPAADDRRPVDRDPADVVVGRDSVRLTVVALLQQLPPKQRAVLILRDVLSWQAAEVAELLKTSVASVNSALQRARATLRSSDTSAAENEPRLDAATAELLAHYIDAFEQYDLDALTWLVRRDASRSTPAASGYARQSGRCSATTASCSAGMARQ